VASPSTGRRTLMRHRSVRRRRLHRASLRARALRGQCRLRIAAPLLSQRTQDPCRTARVRALLLAEHDPLSIGEPDPG
jgi:hypothetical protein